MLQIENVRKSYTTGSFTQVALDGVSVSFRDSEFVAILGPSGSGKTTLLNIIGGLDHYDSGDLIIDGISTKKYKDRDWDTYRNNRVGFVFQSYNLIPHQSVLRNVELALTLSGVGSGERERRAREALAAVGLEDHINKRPNQLSGGQMQRVAIARALINDPTILLADEPTGALDSKTSVQIMNLLTDIAKDRLVVMVTHNPQLAEEYATRVVNLADGQIVSDTQPFQPTHEELAAASSQKIRRTHMSGLTALGLSFNNLMTKKGRTIMTAFAGSIGIIGIAAILALANGINDYITSVEEETLSSYPLQVTAQGFDLAGMALGIGEETHEGTGTDSGKGKDSSGTGAGSSGTNEDTVVGEASIMGRMFDTIGQNDLASLKKHLESPESGIDKYVKTIQYKYNLIPQIYLADTTGGPQRINPDTTFNAFGMGSTSASAGAGMMALSSTDQFKELLGTVEMAQEGYELKAGHWPQKYNEVVLALNPQGKVLDFTLYVLGLRDRTKMEEMVRAFTNGEELETQVADDAEFTYGDFLGLKMKLINAADLYQHDVERSVWVDKSGDDAFVTKLVNQGEDIVISGIVQPEADGNANMMQPGLYYTPKLTAHLIEMSGDTEIVKQQVAAPNVNVFNGKVFGEEDKDTGDGTGSGSGPSLDMSSLFTMDETKLQQAFKIDQAKLRRAMTAGGANAATPGLDASQLPPLPVIDLSTALGQGGGTKGAGTGVADTSQTAQPDPTVVAAMMRELMSRYQSEVKTWGANTDAFMASPGAQRIVASYLPRLVPASAGSAGAAGAGTGDTTAVLEARINTVVQAQVGAYLQQTMAGLNAQMAQIVQSSVQQTMDGLPAAMQTAMSVDAGAFQEAFQSNMTEDQLSELVISMMTTGEASYDGNLAKLGYADVNDPFEIDIFPRDFKAKQGVIGVLDGYNADRTAAGEEEKVVSYTDLVGVLMRSVTTIIDMISYVLIAFVSISLIVSSIMIGVITYISVLERRKEIGILRAIGASKRDISRVFNAETIIEGLIAGLLGVGVTALLTIPASAIVYNLFEVPNIAQLPLSAAVILVVISVVLTFLAGLVPARRASKADPVEALRSE